MKIDKMKCLRSISDCKTQIYGVKVICMLLGYLFCFKVASLWYKPKVFWFFRSILCLVLQGCLLFLGLDMLFMVTWLWYRTKDIDSETKFLSVMFQVIQGHLIVARGKHGHFSGYPLIQIKRSWLWNQFCL